MKLQYRETKWCEAETGIEIAPQDQEKVNEFIFKSLNPPIWADIKYFEANSSKLYDSGDLVFRRGAICEVCNKQGLRNCGYFDECGNAKEYWFLKDNRTVTDKVQVEGEEKLLPLLNFGIGPIEAKVKYSTLEEVVSKYEDKIKQLQSRIAELEEQRERLIAKLINAEDKLKEFKESN